MISVLEMKYVRSSLAGAAPRRNYFGAAVDIFSPCLSRRPRPRNFRSGRGRSCEPDCYLLVASYSGNFINSSNSDYFNVFFYFSASKLKSITCLHCSNCVPFTRAGCWIKHVPEFFFKRHRLSSGRASKSQPADKGSMQESSSVSGTRGKSARTYRIREGSLLRCNERRKGRVFCEYRQLERGRSERTVRRPAAGSGHIMISKSGQSAENNRAFVSEGKVASSKNDNSFRWKKTNSSRPQIKGRNLTKVHFEHCSLPADVGALRRLRAEVASRAATGVTSRDVLTPWLSLRWAPRVFLHQ